MARQRRKKSVNTKASPVCRRLLTAGTVVLAAVAVYAAYGSVLQTAELGPEGEERRLAEPLPFLWTEDCFPDLEPRPSPFPLPDSRRRTGPGG